MKKSNPTAENDLIARRIETLPVNRVQRSMARAEYVAAESTVDRFARAAGWIMRVWRRRILKRRLGGVLLHRGNDD